jgi:hypothetical protein
MATAEHHYCEQLPRELPAGRYLVHNHIKPVSRLGRNGFRAWTQKWNDNLVECRCDFGGCKNDKLHKHYRIRRACFNARAQES